MGTEVNAAQAERWNGESAQFWIRHRERHQRLRERLTPRLLAAAAIAPGDRVLDVGCGCGETTIAAARTAGAGPGGEALGLDLSAPMLDVARALAAAAGVSNVEFVRGDAQVYPLPRRHFDVELSSFGVMFFDDPAAAFGNLLGALRPGGRLAFLCWQDDAANELFGIAQHALLAHASLPAPTDLAPFADTGWVTALLGAAGAQDIQIDAVREPSRLGSDVPDVLDYMVHMGRFSRQFTQLDAATAERVRAALVDEFSRRQRPDGVWVDSAAWLVRARAA